MIDLRNGDCLEVLASMPDACVDAVVTDPPYGLSAAKNSGNSSNGGFMGKQWDYDVPSKEIWEQCLRVLKPGGHLLAFAGTRTQHRMCVNIEDAGFEIRDMIAWVYGSGFPKSRNVGEGWGTALKPALEPITVARKPFKGTVVNNVLEHGTGAINIDDCRVGTSKEVPASVSKASQFLGQLNAKEDGTGSGHDPNVGRWPANLIHDGSDQVTELFPQTAPSKSGGKAGWQDQYVGGKYKAIERTGYDDNGGSAARFFYTAKASKDDRDKGNTHPTVKPTDLMAYLCRLVTPVGGTVLDPFMGSGTTGKAALSEGFSFIGIERDPEYYAICESRFNGAQIGLALAV